MKFHLLWHTVMERNDIFKNFEDFSLAFCEEYYNLKKIDEALDLMRAESKLFGFQ